MTARSVFGRTWTEGPWLIAMMILGVSLLHYNTAVHIHEAHGIYRRLYYFPVLIAAFRYGRRGGLLAALAACALYAPHAFGLIGFDPAFALEKSLEMVLYFAVGLVAGVLVDREHATQARLRLTAEDLQRTLSDRDRMASQLLRSERLAAVGRLSAGLAHEIRNPLASIRGSAEVISDDFPPDHPKSRLVRILLDETGRLNDVLTRFLTFARGEPATATAFDMGAEARAVVALVRQRPGAPQVALSVHPAVPNALGNREQARQVLLNLALNALTAAGADGRVRLVVDAADAYVRCRVEDTGPGFSEEAAANFGTPFYTTTRGGTGLGLATSLRLIEDMAGSLSVDGDADGGCVVLLLPRAPEGTRAQPATGV